ISSNDRHAEHDSPYRTGQHVPLPQSRHAPLTSVATSAMESRADLNSPYAQDEPSTSNGFIGSPKGPLSPLSPYSPGMRSILSRRGTAEMENPDKSSAEIQMQNFSEGLPPPPPVSHSWRRIDRWAEDNYNELFDNLCEPCTQNDVNDLEHQLDCTLPMEVRESLQVHDGQERGGRPTGIIFGCMLLDCEEIIEEWTNWRTVNEEYLTQPAAHRTPQFPIKAFAGASSSSAPPQLLQQSSNPLWRQELLGRQDSQPPNAIQKAYAHPAWIPLARDWGGNCLAVDLAPGPAGKWGQVILFGRDYDCKYVVSRSWAAFLAMVADDLGSDKVSIDEETGDLKLLEFKARQNVEPPYMEILRWRTDQRYGRKAKRRSTGPLHINSNVGGSSSAGASPYASPTSAASDIDRGRSPARFGPKAPVASSPRAHISSPLARVAEEAPQPIKIHTDMNSRRKSEVEKLVSIDSPLISNEKTGKISIDGSDKENAEKRTSNGTKPGKDESEMKTVEI
ncbi:cell wall assembly and cell proliferation coordinating protein, partial [Patellaria atrata CBS 101060]